MRLYGIKMFNFMRFGESDNCIVFDISKSQKEQINNKTLSFDKLYESISEDPLEYSRLAKTCEDNVMKGIIGIAGMTSGSFDDSNGSGKSTIFEAISYLMYDRVVRQTANTDKRGPAGLSVVTKLAGQYPTDLKESYVEAYFEEDDRLYRLKRGRSFTKNQNTNTPIFEFDNIMNDEVDKLSGHRKSDTKKSLEEVIVEDYEIFVNTVMFGQNDAGKFLVGTDKIKKDMIIELLKLEDVVHGCIDVVRVKKKIENDALNNLQSRSKSLQELVVKSFKEFDDGKGVDLVYSEEFVNSFSDLIKEKIKKQNDNKEIFIEKSETVKKLIKKLEDSDTIKRMEELIESGKKLVGEKKEKEERKSKDLIDWKNLIKENIDRKISIKDKLSSDERRGKTVSEKIEEHKKVISSFSVDKNAKEIELCEKAKSLKPQLKSKLSEIEEKITKTVKNLADFDALIKIKKSELSKIEENVSKSGDKFICSECKSVVTKEHTLQKKSEIELVISKNQEGRISVADTLSKLNEAKVSFDNKLKKISEYEVQYQLLTAEKEKYNNSINSLEDLKTQLDDFVKRNKENSSEIFVIESKINEYEEKCKNIEAEFEIETKELTERISKMREEVLILKDSSSEIRREIDRLKKEDSDIALEIEKIGKLSGSYQEKIDQVVSLGKQIFNEENNISEKKKQLQRYLILENAFGLDGVQTRIVEKYLPLLNLYVKQFLDILSGGKLSVKMFVSDKLKVDMEIIGGTSDSYVMLSGGEKMIVRLAVDIGLSLLSFSRTSRVPDMICLDEIFGPLDNNNTKSVFLMLNELKARFNRVFLISHKQKIQSLVENNIIVEKASGNRGLSKVVGISDIPV